VSVVRSIGEGERRAYLDQISRTFSGNRSNEVEVERWGREVEDDRALAALDGDQIVGSAATVPVGLTVPGGAILPTGAVIAVTVRATHRRRGMLRALMRRLLEQLHERGEPLSGLTASEGSIYRRFGYGIGTYEARVEVPRHRSAFRIGVPVDCIRYIERDEAMRVLPALDRRISAGRPGWLERPAIWWEHALEDPKDRQGRSELFIALHEGADGPDGYATYRMRWEDDGWNLAIDDLAASDGAVYASVWRHCLDVDLMRVIRAPSRPVDEPLRFLLADHRAVERKVRDMLWLRLVDVPVALESRRYAQEGSVRIRVEDDFCEWNRGTYLLEGGPDGARCRLDAGEPDLVIDAATLSECYLGCEPLELLAWAGVVEELRPGAVERAGAMLATPLAPWCPTGF
jgi:predicted acetyltransferase